MALAIILKTLLVLMDTITCFLDKPFMVLFNLVFLFRFMLFNTLFANEFLVKENIRFFMKNLDISKIFLLV